MEEQKESLKKKLKHHDYCCEDWKGLGYWYSWDSPIGLGLGFAIVLLSVGLFIYLLHLSGLIG